MNIGGGEAADKLTRMMLSGGEVALRLGGSAVKNLLALTMALVKSRKTVSGKVNLNRMLRETRDLRVFPMTPDQYRQFRAQAKKQKILFSAIKDKDGKGKLVDVVMPATELDRANLVFERILYRGAPEQEEKAAPGRAKDRKAKKQEKEAAPPKKGTRSGRDSPDTKTRSSTPAASGRTTSDRPSVERLLQKFRAQLGRQPVSALVRDKGPKVRPRQR